MPSMIMPKAVAGVDHIYSAAPLRIAKLSAEVSAITISVVGWGSAALVAVGAAAVVALDAGALVAVGAGAVVAVGAGALVALGAGADVAGTTDGGVSVAPPQALNRRPISNSSRPSRVVKERA